MAKLGQLLVARGWITVQQLTRALKNQNVAGGRIGTCLLEMDAITEELLLKGLSEQLGVPSAAADDLRGVQDEVLGLIPEKLARRCRAVPFRVEGGRLDLALMDPRNLSAQDEIAFASGKRVKVYVAEELRVLEALDKYYHEECPSRFGMVLDRLNRARFLWEKPAPERTESQGELLPSLDSPFDNRLAAPPKIQLPPPLPELAPLPARAAGRGGCRVPQRRDALAAARRRAGRGAEAETAGRHSRSPAARPGHGAARSSHGGARRGPGAGCRHEGGGGRSRSRLPRLGAPPRSQSVSLTPEERADLGAVAWVEPASTDRSLPIPASLDEVETALGKATDLEEVARVLLGFLGRDHRRAAIFQVTRERINGWRVHGTGIDREAFAAFSIGFDQPSLFLNLRHGSSLYLGPLPPMPAHRQLARTWGGDLPRDCVMLPVRIKDRLLMVVYADGATRGPVELQQMQRLMNAATSAVERCILANRQRGEAKS